MLLINYNSLKNKKKLIKLNNSQFNYQNIIN